MINMESYIISWPCNVILTLQIFTIEELGDM